MHANKRNPLLLAALAAIVTIAALAAAVPAGRQLARTLADSETAWREIAQIQSTRVAAASAALDATTSQGSTQHALAARQTQARAAVERAKAAGNSEDVLYDPASINTWKKAQGELTGALFMLAAPENNYGQPPNAVLEKLRMQLIREEQALAAARARFSQSSAEYSALSNTAAGAAVTTLLRYPELPATL